MPIVSIHNKWDAIRNLHLIQCNETTHTHNECCNHITALIHHIISINFCTNIWHNFYILLTQIFHLHYPWASVLMEALLGRHHRERTHTSLTTSHLVLLRLHLKHTTEHNFRGNEQQCNACTFNPDCSTITASRIVTHSYIWHPGSSIISFSSPAENTVLLHSMTATEY